MYYDDEELEVPFLLNSLTDIYFNWPSDKVSATVDRLKDMIVEKYLSMGLSLDDCDLSTSKKIATKWAHFEKLSAKDIHSLDQMEKYRSALFFGGEEIREILYNVIPDMMDNLYRILDTDTKDITRITKYTEFILQLPLYADIMHSYINTRVSLDKKYEQLKFDKLKAINNGKLYSDLKHLCDYNTSKGILLFHGTTCREDAYSITEKGFGMHRPELSTTTYTNMTAEQALMYSRGMDHSIGSEAMVVLYQPNGVEIVENIGDVEIDNPGSGLRGFGDKLEYIVPTKYIVGIVDKVSGDVIYNPYFEYKEEFGLTNHDYSDYFVALEETKESTDGDDISKYFEDADTIYSEEDTEEESSEKLPEVLDIDDDWDNDLF